MNFWRCMTRIPPPQPRRIVRQWNTFTIFTASIHSAFYLTNMKSAGASHSASTMFHNWFAHGTRWERVSETAPGPPPEYLVGGPNPFYSNDKCTGYRCYLTAF